MSEHSDESKSIVNEEERRRLITEIGKMKETLDSFKYGLNFEDFANELFKTIDRQTVTIKRFESKMDDIVSRMEKLEKELEQGISVRLRSYKESAEDTSDDEVIIEREETPSEDIEPSHDASKDELLREADEIRTKIARLFEKENELAEMELNDPAGADEYADKARVASEMRKEFEIQLKEIQEKIENM